MKKRKVQFNDGDSWQIGPGVVATMQTANGRREIVFLYTSGISIEKIKKSDTIPNESSPALGNTEPAESKFPAAKTGLS